MTVPVDSIVRRTVELNTSRLREPASAFLRLAIAAGFLSAVADRLGFWGPPGAILVSWGNFHNFLFYTAKLNPWCPAVCIPLLGAAVTIAEAGLGILLIAGFATRVSALLSGMITLAFGAAMTFVLGVHAPLNYSVFVFSAAAFLLASQEPDKLTIDRLFKSKRSHRERRSHAS
jgi:uncharacterized membrane protein YphA (DoxX/SURF4 family)